MIPYSYMYMYISLFQILFLNCKLFLQKGINHFAGILYDTESLCFFFVYKEIEDTRFASLKFSKKPWLSDNFLLECSFTVLARNFYRSFYRVDTQSLEIFETLEKVF